jgi:putative dimethyl sulfoxide reductase chaperone
MSPDLFVAEGLRSAERAPAWIIASYLSAYPTESFLANLQILLEDPRVTETLSAIAPEPWEYLCHVLAQVQAGAIPLDSLRSDFIEVFERGNTRSPLYESDYGSGRAGLKGQLLGDIASFYSAFGFGFDASPENTDMLDHVAVELEFYALLTMKMAALVEANDAEGCDIVASGRKKFLKEHLGTFVSSLSQRPSVAANPFYGVVFALIDALVADECKALNVEPDHANWMDAASESGCSMTCGSGCAAE